MSGTRLLTPLDALLVLALLLAGAGGVWLSRQQPSDGAAGTGQWARVEVDGRLVARLSLRESGERWVTGRYGDMLIETAPGRVRVKDERPLCPRRICLSTGWIDRPGVPIVCVPNHLVVRIEGGAAPEEGGYDAVAR